MSGPWLCAPCVAWQLDPRPSTAWLLIVFVGEAWQDLVGVRRNPCSFCRQFGSLRLLTIHHCCAIFRTARLDARSAASVAAAAVSGNRHGSSKGFSGCLEGTRARDALNPSVILSKYWKGILSATAKLYLVLDTLETCAACTFLLTRGPL